MYMGVASSQRSNSSEPRDTTEQAKHPTPNAPPPTRRHSYQIVIRHREGDGGAGGREERQEKQRDVRSSNVRLRARAPPKRRRYGLKREREGDFLLLNMVGNKRSGDNM